MKILELGSKTILLSFLQFYSLVSTERSHILKQTGSFQLQVCLGMCGFLVNNKH